MWNFILLTFNELYYFPQIFYNKKDIILTFEQLTAKILIKLMIQLSWWKYLAKALHEPRIW